MKKRGFKERLYGFMYGRYGLDGLGKLILIVYAIIIIANIFFNSVYLYALSLILALLFVLRVLSKAVHVRKKENERYLKAVRDIKGFFALQKNRFRDRKTHVYRRCPSCKATLRLPKRKGEHSAKCPRCGNTFEIRG